MLQKIDHYKEHPDKNLATDPDSQEYRLIVQANNLSVEIDNEMLIVHKVSGQPFKPVLLTDQGLTSLCLVRAVHP